MNKETIHTSVFEKLALDMLEKLAEYVASSTQFDDIDIELQMGVLTLTLLSGKQWVINKHNPSTQIWYSSPVSGAHYFSYNIAHERWLNHTGQELLAQLQQELSVSME